MIRLSAIAPILLFSLVATQIVYVVCSQNGVDINRPVIWTSEAVIFIGLTVLALSAPAREGALAPVWAAIAASGMLNTIQVGMGLAMFGPLSDAGEPLAAAYNAVVASAFFLFFAGKFLFGLAAILIGAMLFGRGGMARLTGGVAMVSGLAAMAANVAAMATGMALVFPAGAAGTAATFMLAIGLAMVAQRRDVEPG